ncbi:MAG: recombinational DNA repair protein (RecE pathway) [Firmicutes bacterium]|nr:recombinational DNA repair protein (RecE pathway) [Bacillota bacterium]
MAKNQVVTQEQLKGETKPTASERFTQMVIKEFGSGVGEIALTDAQRRLAQNYFIAIDEALKTSEINRQKKSEKYRDKLPVVWENVNMRDLAINVVAYARMGLDPLQKNHINPIPYKNNTTNKYDIGFIEGYRGIELKAKKYGIDVPDVVVVELVYKSDKFKPIKKDKNNPYESYVFEIENPFDRGEIVGGFYYHSYSQNPEKNKTVVFNLEEILKRKPKHAAPEFWGGEKDVWEDGKKIGKEKVEGWFEKMCWKTMYRAAYNDITIDSTKIDDAYLRTKEMEMKMAEFEVEEEIRQNANSEAIDVEYEVSDAEDAPPSDANTRRKEGDPEPKQENKPGPKQDKQSIEAMQMNMTDTGGPGF